MRKLTQEEAIKRISLQHPDFDFSQFIYNGGKGKGKVRCSKNHEWETSYDSLVSSKNHGCPICSGNKKLTQEEAVANLKQKHPNYDFSKFIYINARKPSTVKCDKGHEWNVCYYSSMTGCGCPECIKEKKPEMKRLKFSTVIGNLQKIHPDYDFSQFEYTHHKAKSLVTCSKGHTWLASYSKLVIGHGCPECLKRTQEEAIQNMQEQRPDYDFSLFEYKSSIIKSTVKCDKGHVFLMRYSKIMEGVGCPECKMSKGEYRIKKWLKQHNIHFEVQKTFKDAKYKDYLRWDFFIPSENLLIEYNGRQHYVFET